MRNSFSALATPLMLPIALPNSTITVSQMHIPSKQTLKKTLGGIKKFSCGYSIKSDIKFNFVLGSSAYMRNISSNSFIIP